MSSCFLLDKTPLSTLLIDYLCAPAPPAAQEGDPDSCALFMSLAHFLLSTFHIHLSCNFHPCSTRRRPQQPPPVFVCHTRSYPHFTITTRVPLPLPAAQEGGPDSGAGSPRTHSGQLQRAAYVHPGPCMTDCFLFQSSNSANKAIPFLVAISGAHLVSE